MGAPSYSRQTILDLCRKYGPAVHVPPGVDGVRLMAAIAANESSLGYNSTPRYEASYDKGGVNCKGLQADLVARYGRAAACSYGPWQVMFVNCQPLTLAQMMSDPDAGAQAFVQFFNSYVIDAKQAKTLTDIGQIYNAGHTSAAASPAVLKYVHDLKVAYIDNEGDFGAPSIA